MDLTTTIPGTVARPLLVHWVPVVDGRGRGHLEMRWAPAEAPSPAPTSTHHQAA